MLPFCLLGSWWAKGETLQVKLPILRLHFIQNSFSSFFLRSPNIQTSSWKQMKCQIFTGRFLIDYWDWLFLKFNIFFNRFHLIYRWIVYLEFPNTQEFILWPFCDSPFISNQQWFGPLTRQNCCVGQSYGSIMVSGYQGDTNTSTTNMYCVSCHQMCKTTLYLSELGFKWMLSVPSFPKQIWRSVEEFYFLWNRGPLVLLCRFQLFIRWASCLPSWATRVQLLTNQQKNKSANIHDNVRRVKWPKNVRCICRWQRLVTRDSICHVFNVDKRLNYPWCTTTVCQKRSQHCSADAIMLFLSATFYKTKK